MPLKHVPLQHDSDPQGTPSGRQLGGTPSWQVPMHTPLQH
jgi:hypothetical protein